MGSIMTEQLHGESLAGNRVDPVGPVGLTDALRLPCGVVLPNRIAKAAMTECLADPGTNDPNVRHERLFQRWAQGGVGLMVTGNVMVDRRYHRRASDWFAATKGHPR
jgi:2,4-dienoyl-CoA reductase-like NADH-dependent reductase (Old Yellow Enzyme family)